MAPWLRVPESSLHRQSGGGRWLWVASLAAALAMQVAALLLPFMQVKAFIAGGEVYSLLHTVRLMASAGYWIIAILIALFSVAFPFAKIGVLLVAWFLMPAGETRTRMLEWMGWLGKWSMLDPLAVLLLVLLTTDQWAVTATTYLGVHAFLTAVATSMVLAIVAGALDRSTTGGGDGAFDVALEQDSPRRPLIAGVPGAIAFLVLLATVASGCGMLEEPFFQVSGLIIESSSYSVAGVPLDLVRQQNWPLAGLALVGLVVMPAVVLLAEAWSLTVPASAAVHRRRRTWIAVLREWSMLDVMALATGLFLLEGQGVIRTDVREGLWFLVGTALGLILLGWLAARATKAIATGS